MDYIVHGVTKSWTWLSNFHFHFLKNQMINSNNHCSQLDQPKEALDKKHLELVNRECIIFHRDTTKPYVSLMTKQKSLYFGREVLIHWLYSPEIASLYFHLFWSFQNSLNGNNFNSLDGEGNGYQLQYSWLEGSMDRGIWWATVHILNSINQILTANFQGSHSGNRETGSEKD